VEISRPRTRPHANSPLEPSYDPEPRVVRFPPADPRNYWRPGSRMNDAAVEPIIESPVPRQWSPHLLHDIRATKAKRSLWKPPSIDETKEKIFSRRNIQVYSFCLGFVFPLAWLIASFLPLPSKISHLHQEATTSSPNLEHAFENRVILVDEVRYENARWWRNLNRCMMPLGVGVITTVITLSIIGTRMRGL